MYRPGRSEATRVAEPGVRRKETVTGGAFVPETPEDAAGMSAVGDTSDKMTHESSTASAAATNTAGKRGASAGMSAVKYYLFVYNMSMALGWTYILGSLGHCYLNGSGPENAFAYVGFALAVWQTGAIFEVLHAAFGFVRSPVISTFIQVLSRVYVYWLVARPFPQMHQSPVFSSMVFAWCLAEIPRYLTYALSLTGTAPQPLVWVRYSGFMLLYPLGAGSEIVLTYLSLPLQREALPKPWMYVVCILALVCYVPGLPYMYYYMLRQRKKQIGKPKKPKAL
ncbi:Very-long-chain (3R)-3-hydroxyacyl-CoA dehydratase PASTICCINO 2B [Porphyridium purpureum]|uniref:very-long-chain (3R)-3-hydroxyacyl-CoA dehydratase n=1 Tax=Porphyridium purpureum TaxID=35688 RepID=A0A5J4YXS5_PORPP|nr:Very-long-chain (3R)-3-hydroxyacyl-CoA dehydratase PASTICCINO 2B [Porphyridium purpureum]|eukprot:POR9067..scf209_3